jgi:threonyl-tRNA synthetase
MAVLYYIPGMMRMERKLSLLHVMAQVLEEMYPGIKLTLGPSISNGFYYDVDFEDQRSLMLILKNRRSCSDFERKT